MPIKVVFFLKINRLAADDTDNVHWIINTSNRVLIVGGQPGFNEEDEEGEQWAGQRKEVDVDVDDSGKTSSPTLR